MVEQKKLEMEKQKRGRQRAQQKGKSIESEQHGDEAGNEKRQEEIKK